MKTQSKTRIGAIMIAAILLGLAFRTTQPCTVSGTVTERETADSIFGANVLLSQNGKQIQQGTTDFEGKFCLTGIPDGNYDITVNSVGFTTVLVKGIPVKDGQSKLVDVQLKPSALDLKEVVIVNYKVPLIDPNNTSSKNTISAEEISNMPTNIRGGREEGVQYYIDGVKVTGAPTTTSARPYQGIAAQKMRMSESYDMAPAPTTNYDWEVDPRPKDREKKPDDIDFNTESYDAIVENEFLKPTDKALSTFSIDVDVASYGILRKKLATNQTPPKSSIRLEELINYFTYNYPDPKDDKPFSVNTEIGDCPWNTKHQLLHVGIQGKRMDKSKLPPSNLVFLIDVSGSMQTADRLPLVKESLRLLVKELNENDKIAMTVYAGSAGLVLPSTSCSQKDKIIQAIDRLEAGGSTAGAAGINLAYKVAKENFLENGNNRVILCTDGDFNVGVSSDAELTSLIEKKREEGVFLSVLGFGMGNYQDSKMEKLADKGNGNYAYIDNIQEAKKNLVTQMGGTLLTIAKDVKIQVEFNPAKVKGYRLIGYENRALADKDFNDDKKDAGEIGAGVSVTALYELITNEDDVDLKAIPTTNPLKYQKPFSSVAKNTDEMLNVKIRYKEPKENTSKLLEFPVKAEILALAKTSDNFRFASSVASFGMVLRDSKFKGNFTFEKVKELAKGAKGKDTEEYRAEFISLIDQAKNLTNTVQR